MKLRCFYTFIIAVTLMIFAPMAMAYTSCHVETGVTDYQVMTVVDVGNIEVAAISSADEPCVACNSAVSLTNTTNSKTNTNSTELIKTSGVSVPIMAYSEPRKLPDQGINRVNKCGGYVKPSDVQAKPYAGVTAA